MAVKMQALLQKRSFHRQSKLVKRFGKPVFGTVDPLLGGVFASKAQDL